MTIFAQLVQTIQTNGVHGIITGSNETEMALIDKYTNPQTIAQRFDEMQLRLENSRIMSITARYILYDDIVDEFIFRVDSLHKNGTEWTLLSQSQNIIRWTRTPDGHYGLQYPFGNLTGQRLSNMLPIVRKKIQ